MKKKTFLRIVGIFSLIAVELFLRGVVSGNDMLLGLGGANIFVVLLLGGLYFAGKKGIFHDKKRHAFVSLIQEFLRSYGLVIVLGRWIWEVMGLVMAPLHLWALLVSTGVLGYMVWVFHKDLRDKGLYRGNNKITSSVLWGMLSLLLTMKLLGMFWTAGREKYLFALGGGWLLYSFVLVLQGDTIKTFFKNTLRSLFGILFAFVLLRGGVVSISTWYKDHTIIKEVVKEKEKIVYVEKSSNEEKNVDDESDAEGKNKEGTAGEALSLSGQQGTTVGTGETGLIVGSGGNTQGGSTGDTLLKCDTGYHEQGGQCVLDCGENACLFRKKKCIPKPEHAFCLKDNVSKAWECDDGFEMEGNDCVKKSPPIAPVRYRPAGSSSTSKKAPQKTEQKSEEKAQESVPTMTVEEYLQKNKNPSTPSSVSHEGALRQQIKENNSYSILDKVKERNAPSQEASLLDRIQQRNQ